MGISQWLEQHDLAQYEDVFRDNDIDLSLLPELTEEDLKELGVQSLGHRKRLMKAIAELGAPVDAPTDPTPAEAEPPAELPLEVPFGETPSFLAIPLDEYRRETHPRIRLHWLVDIAELGVRWCVALALAEVRAGSDELPARVAAALRDHIERPTLGRWVAMLRELSAASPESPSLAPGVFDVYRSQVETLFRSGEEGEGVNLLTLRNRIAHGGGLSRNAAAELLEAHEAAFFQFINSVIGVTRGMTVLNVEGARVTRLAGLEPGPAEPEGLPADLAEGPVLLGDGGVWLPLSPLARFHPVEIVGADGRAEEREPLARPQLYARSNAASLVYTPLGSDEAHAERLDVEPFRDLFRLDEAPAARGEVGDEGFAPDEALHEMRVIGEELIGRREELKRVKQWVKQCEPHDPDSLRVGWITGGPGLGKSTLVARLTADLANSPPERQGIYVHRFREGDPRNSTRSFLALLRQALWQWKPLRERTEAPSEDVLDTEKLRRDVHQRMEQLAHLEAPHPKAPPPRFLVVVDGLDEIAGRERDIVSLIEDLALPGSIWITAGRPDHGLAEAMTPPRAEPVWPGDGLPPMSPDDMRAMLLDGLGNLRYDLLERDEDRGDDVVNPFVEAVLERAHGLPLYVHLLLDDLRRKVLTVRDEKRLPDGLAAYYDTLLDRIGLSTVKRDLPLIVALLAVARAPLTEPGLSILVAGDAERAGAFAQRVREAIRAGQSLVRTAPTGDGDDGYILYHQSFRDYVTGEESGAPPPALAGVLDEARDLLARMPDKWSTLPEGPLRRHLFRLGVGYTLEWAPDGVQRTSDRLTDFAYLHERITVLPRQEIPTLLKDVEDVGEALERSGGDPGDYAAWLRFFRDHRADLLAGDDAWGSEKILLQLAVEHADTSPVTRAAEEWVEEHGEGMIWLRNVRRPAEIRPAALRQRLEGHLRYPTGCMPLDKERLLSWSALGEQVRLWDPDSGETLRTLGGEDDVGAEVLDNGLVVTWSRDCTMTLVDPETGNVLDRAEPETSCGYPFASLLTGDGRLVLGGMEGPVMLWRPGSGEPALTLAGHTAMIVNLRELSGGRIASASSDGSVRIWDGEGGCVTIPEASSVGSSLPPWAIFKLGDANLDFLYVQGGVYDVLETSDGRLVSWGYDDELRIWNPDTGERLGGSMIHEDEGHIALVHEEAERGTMLSVSHHSVRRWSLDTGDEVEMLLDLEELASVYPDTPVVATQASFAFLEGRTLMIALFDGIVVFFDLTSGEYQVVYRARRINYWTTAAIPLGEGRMALGGNDLTIGIADPALGEHIHLIPAHDAAFNGITALGPNRIVSMANDMSLRVWDLEDALELSFEGEHLGDCIGRIHPSGEVITWSSDGQLRLWSAEDGRPLGVLGYHESFIQYLILLDNGFVLSRGDFPRLWDLEQRREIGAVGFFGFHDEDHGPDSDAPDLPDQGMSCQSIAEWPGPFSIEGKDYDSLIVTGWNDGTVRMADPDTGHTVFVIQEFDRTSFDEEGIIIPVDIVPLQKGNLAIWSRNGTRVELYFTNDEGGIAGQSLSFGEDATAVEVGMILDVDSYSDDGVIAWTENGWVGIWGFWSARCYGIRKMGPGLEELAVAADRSLVSFHSDRVVRHWDVNDGAISEQPLREVRLPAEAGQAKRINPLDNGILVVAHQNRHVTVWDTKEGLELLASMNERDLTVAHPGVLQHVPIGRLDSNPRLKVADWAGYAWSNRMALVNTEDKTYARWYGPGRTRMISMNDKGQLLVSTGTHLELIQAFRGTSPAALADLQH